MWTLCFSIVGFNNVGEKIVIYYVSVEGFVFGPRESPDICVFFSEYFVTCPLGQLAYLERKRERGGKTREREARGRLGNLRMKHKYSLCFWVAHGNILSTASRGVTQPEKRLLDSVRTERDTRTGRTKDREKKRPQKNGHRLC